MITRSLFFLLTALSLQNIVQAQADQAPSLERAREPYQGAWKAEEQQSASDLWRAISEREPDNTQARYNQFISTRNASLARNDGELPEADRKELSSIAVSLKKSAPNSFEAHMAQFHLLFPDRSAFSELNAAASVGPGRIELLGPQLARAMMEGDDASVMRACRSLDDRGGISPALLDVATDLLMSIDQNGIVITNGEMDTYPALVRQRIFGMRKDVLVIDQRMLGETGYRQRCWSQAHAAGSAPGSGPEFVRGLLNSTTRPVFLAMSLDPDWARMLSNELYVTGIALRYSHQRVDNMARLEQRWKAMSKNMYAGPLTANYLLPGAVLLQYFRGHGEEEKAARLEHEVRAIAEAMRMTPKLHQLGIFEH